MKNIYFIGIGGIGMSCIARYYKSKDFAVSGYDKTVSELTRRLESEGIDIHYTDDVKYVPYDIQNTLVVYTPAIPEDMSELKYVKDNGYRVIKRSRMLGEITQGLNCLAVAGTHGKTTTSTLLAHIFSTSPIKCNAFLGGISKNYDSNLILGESKVIVAEADEFDRSFLQLFPHIALITSMDADHLDIYSDHEHVIEAFKAFAGQVKKRIIIKKGLPIDANDTKAQIKTYSFDDAETDYHAENFSIDSCGCFSFDIVCPDKVIKDCKCGVPGRVNVENSIAAASIADSYGVDEESIKKAIETFKGVKRRFDIHYNSENCSYIDDYAHHPNELKAAIASIKGIFPGRKITAVFQPHLFTRTRDFAAEFAEALSAADSLILLDIYPARELPIEGVSSDVIFKDVTLDDKTLIKKSELIDCLKTRNLDVLVTFGAGDIDRLTGEITEMLKNR